MNFYDYLQSKNGGTCPKCRSLDTAMIDLESGKTAHACNECGSSWNWVGQDNSVLVYGPSIRSKKSKSTSGASFTGKKSKSLKEVESDPWGTIAEMAEDPWYNSLKEEQEEDTLSAVPKEFRNKPKKPKEEIEEKEPELPLKPIVRKIIWDRPEPKTE